MNATGILIKQLRLQRNFSQEGLAKGICAASYLSKIEQGQADPSPEIIDRLFSALGVEYCREKAMIKQAKQHLEAYYEYRDQDEREDTAVQWLDANLPALKYSALSLWVDIYHACRALEVPDLIEARRYLEALKPLEAQMDAEQLYRYYLCSAEAAEDWEAALALVKKAARQNPCAHVYWALTYLQFYLGQYSQCVDTAEKAYSLGAEEGDLYAMIWSSFLLASCYTERNLELAETYYRRAIRLSGKSQLRMKQFAAYNLGASYMEWGKQEQALHWLEQTEDVPNEHSHNLLRRQKLAILYADLDRRSEAVQLLEEAEQMLRVLRADPKWKDDCFGEMIRFARLLAENKRTDQEFEQVTRELYERKNLGFGFRRFYGLYLVDLYRSQRKYKDALRIMEEIQTELS